MRFNGSVNGHGNVANGCQSKVNSGSVESVEPDLQIATREQCLASTIIDQRQVGQDADRVDQMFPAYKEKEVTREEAEKTLAKYFKNPGENSSFKKFDFKKFAEVNGITVDESCIPHSDIVSDSFRLMYDVVDELTTNGITIERRYRTLTDIILSSEHTFANVFADVFANINICIGKFGGMEKTNGLVFKKKDIVEVSKIIDDVMEAIDNDGLTKEKLNDFTSKLEKLKVEERDCCNIVIKLTAKEINDASIRVEQSKLSEDEHKTYKLYGELGSIILGKLNEIVENEYFDDSKIAFSECSGNSRVLCKQILSLSLVNADVGMSLCTKLLRLQLCYAWRGFASFSITNQHLNDYDVKFHNRDHYVNEFKKLGMFFAFNSEELAKQLLPTAKFLISVGMKIPLLMAEFSYEHTIIGSALNGITDDLTDIAINTDVKTLTRKLTSKDSFLEYPQSQHTFRHECTHNIRVCVEALHKDKLIARTSLGYILKDHNDVINAIKSQIGIYALTNYEEYIAEFSAITLCCLEKGKNPLDFITNRQLWRLYYEFGGPDYAPIIQQKGLLPDGYAKDCDILSDKKCDWCSGYPSKFGIDVDKVKSNIVNVVSVSRPCEVSSMTIDKNTVLPPPPLGYCYTIEDGILQLEVDEKILPDSLDKSHYVPVFCRLTNGPLTLFRADQFQLKHHFEVLQFDTTRLSVFDDQRVAEQVIEFGRQLDRGLIAGSDTPYFNFPPTSSSPVDFSSTSFSSADFPPTSSSPVDFSSTSFSFADFPPTSFSPETLE